MEQYGAATVLVVNSHLKNVLESISSLQNWPLGMSYAQSYFLT